MEKKRSTYSQASVLPRSGLHAGIPQLVVHLAYLHQEVTPFLVVERHQTGSLALLCDGEVADAVGKGSAVEIAEVTLAQELMIFHRSLP